MDNPLVNTFFYLQTRNDKIMKLKLLNEYVQRNKNKGWIEANEILENDKVLLYNNEEAIVLKKDNIKLNSEENTYNFEVEDNHNYYVSSQLILVHNDCKLARNMKKAGKTI